MILANLINNKNFFFIILKFNFFNILKEKIFFNSHLYFNLKFYWKVIYF